jgi:hypothetical protein
MQKTTKIKQKKVGQAQAVLNQMIHLKRNEKHPTCEYFIHHFYRSTKRK